MRLDEFVEKTLIDICTGIGKAKSNVINNNGAIAPPTVSSTNFPEPEAVHKIREIDFSVSVKVGEDSKLEITGDVQAKSKLPFVSVKAGAGADKLRKNGKEQHNIVRFSVPYFAEAIRPIDNDKS